MESYLVGTLEQFIESDYQAGSIASLLRLLETEMEEEGAEVKVSEPTEGGRQMFPLYIPANETGIPEGTYECNDIVVLLRDNKHDSDVIQFLADMLEE